MAGEHQPPVASTAVSGNPSHSQHDSEDPNSTKPQEAEQSPPQQPPHSETLDFENSRQSSLHDHGVQISQRSDEHEYDRTILDVHNQQSQQKLDKKSGITRTTLPEPIILTKTSLPPPRNRQSGRNKRKKGDNRKNFKNKWQTKKIKNLTDVINPIPFVPKALDLHKHEEVLKRLGLYDFTKIELDRSIRTDLLVQLIVNYDRKKRCSYVNEKKIRVNRIDLARALELPVTKQVKGRNTMEEVDLDSEVYSAEVVGFIEDFVFNWMLLHEESWILPEEIVNWTRCIREGHPEKLDSASLIWYKVEKELNQGAKLVDCYYASHLQHLIMSQQDQLFNVDDGGGVGGDKGEENVKADDEQEEKEEPLFLGEDVEKTVHQDVSDETMVDDVALIVGEDVEKTVHQDVREDDETMVDDVALIVGEDVEKTVYQDVREDDETMVDAEECKEEVEVEVGVEEMEEKVNWKNDFGEHILKRCESSDLNNYEAFKVEEVVDEHIKVEDEEEGADEGERFAEGFDMEANDDSLDRDGLTNFVSYSSHGVSAIDLFGSRDHSFMCHSGPFFNNGGKREMEPDVDTHHLNGNSKRLKTDDMWDQKRNDFGSCMVQMQQWIEKAKMIHDSKEEIYVTSKYHQDSAMNELQDRHQVMEMIIKSKDEELVQKHAQVFRLEREVNLMMDLLAGYKKALNDTRFKFSEYRRRFALQEEPLYKDAGPGGLVLSTRELEIQLLEHDMMKFQTCAKRFEEEGICHLNVLAERVLKMAEKLMFVGNEMKRLKEIATRHKETQKTRDELELSPKSEENQKSLEKHELVPDPEEKQKSLDKCESSPEPKEDQKLQDKHEFLPEPEENKKSHDEVPGNDASMESVPPDADESEEKDVEEH